METSGTSQASGDRPNAKAPDGGAADPRSRAPAGPQFKMIDIAEKKDTQRRAVASALFWAAPATIERIRNRTLPKGDVLMAAEIAGIQGAKKTAEWLPLCHPLALTSVRVWTEVTETNQGERLTEAEQNALGFGSIALRVFCEVKTCGKTGVEMEALTGVAAAALCLYDLTKGIDPVLRITDIQLEVKEGGKSGVFLQPGSPRAKGFLSPSSPASSAHSEGHGLVQGSGSAGRSASIASAGCYSAAASAPAKSSLDGIRAWVLVLSDRCSRGEAEDRSGPVAEQWLESRGARVLKRVVLKDDAGAIRAELRSLLGAFSGRGVSGQMSLGESESASTPGIESSLRIPANEAMKPWADGTWPNLIITSGGTGLSQRDITPDTVLELGREFGGREVPGLGELLRSDGAKHNTRSWLSRSTAVMFERTLVVCLPGSPTAVTEGLDAIERLMGHALHTASGGGHG